MRAQKRLFCVLPKLFAERFTLIILGKAKKSNAIELVCFFIFFANFYEHFSIATHFSTLFSLGFFEKTK